MVQKVPHGGAVGQATERGGEAVADQAHRGGAEIAPPWYKKCCMALQLAGKRAWRGLRRIKCTARARNIRNIRKDFFG